MEMRTGSFSSSADCDCDPDSDADPDESLAGTAEPVRVAGAEVGEKNQLSHACIAGEMPRDAQENKWIRFA